IARDWTEELAAARAAPMFRNRDRFPANAHPTRAFDDEIKFFRSRMLVKCVRTLGRQFPQARAKDFASGPLQKIRVRNFHQVRRPPCQIVRLDYEICVDSLHQRISALEGNFGSRAFRAVSTPATGSLAASRRPSWTRTD